MREIKIKNLVNFWFLIWYSDLKDMSPDYIMEKWSKYIGIDIEKINIFDLSKNTWVNEVDNLSFFSISGSFENWVSKWSVDNPEKYKNIFIFLSLIHSNGFLTLSEIIEAFEENIDKVDEINDVLYGNLHPLISSKIEKWLLLPVNNRDFRLEILNI